MNKNQARRIVSFITAVALAFGGIIPGLYVKALAATVNLVEAGSNFSPSEATVKNSAANSANQGRYAFDEVYVDNSGSNPTGHYWQFPAAVLASGRAYIAVDLGSVKTVESASIISNSTLSNTKARMISYSVAYTNDDAVWASLYSGNVYQQPAYEWENNGWTEAVTKEIADVTTTMPVQIVSGTPAAVSDSNNLYDSVSFSPIQARYVMIGLRLNTSGSGGMGLANIKLFGDAGKIPALISPASATYTKGSSKTISSTITLNDSLLLSISSGGAALVSGSDYTEATADRKTEISFSNAYLDSLPAGLTELIFDFDTGAQVFELTVREPVIESKPNLLEGISFTDANLKVSSSNSGNTKFKAIGDGTSNLYWQQGGTAANMFPDEGGTCSLWLALDLGAIKKADGVKLDIPLNKGYEDVITRMTQYRVFTSTDTDVWNALPAQNNTVRSMFEPADNGWALSYVKPSAEMTASSPVNANWIRDEGDFEPVDARYILICITETKINNNYGTIGLANLRIIGETEAFAKAVLTPAEAVYKRDGGKVSTVITLNGSSLESIKTGQTVLAQGTDYILNASGDTLEVNFNQSFLNSLPTGKNSLMFNFISGVNEYTVSFDIIVSIFADTYLNDPGSGFAIIMPDYSGMSLTIGQPAIIDLGAAKDKFPVFNITNGKAGTVITGTLYSPNCAAVYAAAQTPLDSDGKASVKIPDETILESGTYRMEFILTNNSVTYYDNYYFTAVSDFATYAVTKNEQNSNNANVANVHPDSPPAAGSYPALLGTDDLKYFPDYKGNQVMDYSDVGYQGGGVLLPNVPIRARLKPLADDKQDAYKMIQDALDSVSSLPVREDGYRGAVYLEEGVYRISQPLYIRESGVVLRGAGMGTATEVSGSGTVSDPYTEGNASLEFEAGTTKLISTWKLTDNYTPLNNHDASGPIATALMYGEGGSMINIKGGAPEYTITSTITDQYVGTGQRTVHVADISGFSVGDILTVRKAVNVNWAKSMYMDMIDGENTWLSADKKSLISGLDGQPFNAERTIAAIDLSTKAITFTEPLPDNLDMRWGVSTVVKTLEGDRLSNCGVENIQAIADFINKAEEQKIALTSMGNTFLSWNDENHAMVFVNMTNVRDGFVRNFITYHIDRGFQTTGETRNITVQDGKILNPVSQMNAGERRYSVYYRNSSFMFSQRVEARFMRHAYIVDSTTSGPNVFYNEESSYNSNSSEPHFRWSSGGLYDNVTSRIHIQNRWSYGTSHGWSGVNYVMYNCTGPYNISQPQISPVYLIGHYFDANNNKLGNVNNPATGFTNFGHSSSGNLAAAGVNGGIVPNFPAYTYSLLSKVTPAANNMPDSLYLQQLVNSHGYQAADNLLVDTVPENIYDISELRLTALYLNGNLIDNFDPEKFSYTVYLPLEGSAAPVVTASADSAINVAVEYPDDITKDSVHIILTNDSGQVTVYKIAFDSIQTIPIVTASTEQVDATNKNYAINVLNDEPYNGPTSVRWAGDGAVWIRMYLGNTKKTVSGVQIGFNQTTNTRTYMLRIEYSTDGRTWETVTSGTVTSDTQSVPTAWTCKDDAYFYSLMLSSSNAATRENTLQSFTFDVPVTAHFIRVCGNGNITGAGSNAWNTYWRLRPLFGDGSVYTPPTSITVTGESNLNISDVVQFSATVDPENATVKDVVWSSSNPAVAKVDSYGKVTAVSNGKAVISAQTSDGAFLRTEGVSTGTIQYVSNGIEVTVGPSASILAFVDYPVEAAQYSSAADSVIRVEGWALYSSDGKKNDINDVEIYLNGELKGNAAFVQRPDVEAAIKGYPDYSKSGYSFDIPAASLPDGQYTVSVKVNASTGDSQTLSRNIYVNKQAMLMPYIGIIDYPTAYTTGIADVSGWALCSADGLTDAIDKVEIFIDGISVGVASRYERVDVSEAIKGYGDYSECGYSLQVDFSAYSKKTLTISAKAFNGDKLLGETVKVVTAK